MESKKRKREPDVQPRVTYHAPNRTFDRLFKENSLEETRDVVKRKLGLSSGAKLHLAQIRDGKTIDLEDDDDFDAFRALARTVTSVDVQVTVAATDDTHGLFSPNEPTLGPESTSSISQLQPNRAEPLSSGVSSHGFLHDSAISADNRPNKKRRALTSDVEDLAHTNPLPTRIAEASASTNAFRRKEVVPVAEFAISGLAMEAPSGSTVSESKKKKRKTAKKTPEEDRSLLAGGPEEQKEFTPLTSTKARKAKKTDGARKPSQPNAPQPSPSLVPPETANQPASESNTAATETTGEPKPQERKGRRKGDSKIATMPSTNAPVVDKSPELVKEAVAKHRKASKAGNAKVLSVQDRASLEKAVQDAIDRALLAEPASPEKRLCVEPSSSVPKPARKKAKKAQPKDGNLGTEVPLEMATSQAAVHQDPPPQDPPPKASFQDWSLSALSATRKGPSASDPVCPVCKDTPFHFRYRCPIVIAGPDAIQRRIEQLKVEDGDVLLIEELESLSAKQAAKRAVRDARATQATAEQPASNASAPGPCARTDSRPSPWQTSIPKGARLSEVTIERRGEGSSSSSSNETDTSDDETPANELGPPSSSKASPVHPAKGPPYTDSDLEAVMRGPTLSHRKNGALDEIPSESVSDSEENGGGAVLEDDNEDDLARHKHKRLERQASPSSESDTRPRKVVVSDSESDSASSRSSRSREPSSAMLPAVLKDLANSDEEAVVGKVAPEGPGEHTSERDRLAVITSSDVPRADDVSATATSLQPEVGAASADDGDGDVHMVEGALPPWANECVLSPMREPTELPGDLQYPEDAHPPVSEDAGDDYPGPVAAPAESRGDTDAIAPGTPSALLREDDGDSIEVAFSPEAVKHDVSDPIQSYASDDDRRPRGPSTPQPGLAKRMKSRNCTPGPILSTLRLDSFELEVASGLETPISPRHRRKKHSQGQDLVNDGAQDGHGSFPGDVAPPAEGIVAQVPETGTVRAQTSSPSNIRAATSPQKRNTPAADTILSIAQRMGVMPVDTSSTGANSSLLSQDSLRGTPANPLPFGLVADGSTSVEHWATLENPASVSSQGMTVESGSTDEVRSSGHDHSKPSHETDSHNVMDIVMPSSVDQASQKQRPSSPTLTPPPEREPLFLPGSSQVFSADLLQVNGHSQNQFQKSAPAPQTRCGSPTESESDSDEEQQPEPAPVPPRLQRPGVLGSQRTPYRRLTDIAGSQQLFSSGHSQRNGFSQGSLHAGSDGHGKGRDQEESDSSESDSSEDEKVSHIPKTRVASAGGKKSKKGLFSFT